MSTIDVVAAARFSRSQAMVKLGLPIRAGLHCCRDCGGLMQITPQGLKHRGRCEAFERRMAHATALAKGVA